MVDKVAVFITRMGSDGPELCVFEHPFGGIQIPAGSLEVGEDPLEGARREAFEETGLDGLRVVAELCTAPAARAAGDAVVARAVRIGSSMVPRGNYAEVLEVGPDRCLVRVSGLEGWVERSDLSFDGRRHLVHLTTAEPAPAQWWVATPDGGGMIWRCHWMPLGRRGYLGEWHQEWLDLVLRRLTAVPHPTARPRGAFDPMEADLSIELFFAPPWGGRRVLFSLLECPRSVPDAEVGRSEAIVTTDQGDVVAVGGGEPVIWGLPGGRREAGESLVDTLVREVAEEACARVLDHRLLGYQRFAYLTGDTVERVQTDAMFWARVELDPFEPRFETTQRRLLSAAEALAEPMWNHPITGRLFALVEQVQAGRSRRIEPIDARMDHGR